jgi:outer membrane biosynthesis protein TonB
MHTQQSPASGVEILSDTEGADVEPFLRQWIHITVTTLVKLAPTEANKASLQPGVVVVRFKILPNGKIMDGGMVLEERSGQSELDKIAWDAVARSAYPPLPEQFHGPYLELRWHLVYKDHQAK